MHQKTNSQVSYQNCAKLHIKICKIIQLHKSKNLFCYDGLSSKSTKVYSYAVNTALSQLCSHFLDLEIFSGRVKWCLTLTYEGGKLCLEYCKPTY